MIPFPSRMGVTIMKKLLKEVVIWVFMVCVILITLASAIALLDKAFQYPPKRFVEGNRVKIKYVDKPVQGYVTHHRWASPAQTSEYPEGWKAHVIQSDGKGEYIYEFLLELVPEPQKPVEQELNF